MLRSRDQIEYILKEHEKDEKMLVLLYRAFTGGYQVALDKLERGGIALKEHGNIMKYEEVQKNLKTLGVLGDDNWLIKEVKENE